MQRTREHRVFELMIATAAIALMIICTSGCRLPKPGSPTSGPIQCTMDAMQKCWAVALPAVNGCLVGDNATDCLVDLIQPTGCMAEHIIACLVKNQGAEFAHSAEINPADVRSKRAAENARSYLKERSYTFVE